MLYASVQGNFYIAAAGAATSNAAVYSGYHDGCQQ